MMAGIRTKVVIFQARATMSTAIFFCHTRGGFVVTADGKEGVAGKDVYEHRKIYPIEINDVSLAFAFAGSVAAYDEAWKLMFDFRQETYQLGPSIPTKKCRTLREFADKLSYKLIKKLLRKPMIVDYPDEDGHGTICTLFLAGYFKGEASMVHSRFSVTNHGLNRNPEIKTSPLGSGPIGIGSSRVLKLLTRGETEELNQYRTPAFDKLRDQAPLELSEAQEIGVKFIEACSSAFATQIDPDCEKIGGHIHSAVITPQNGFQWTIPPKETKIS